MRGLLFPIILFGAIGDFILLIFLCMRFGISAFFLAFVFPAFFGIGAVKTQGANLFQRLMEFRTKGAEPVAEGMLLALAGFFLIFPGPISSAIGCLLLIPFLRRGLASLLGGSTSVSSSTVVTFGTMPGQQTHPSQEKPPEEIEQENSGSEENAVRQAPFKVISLGEPDGDEDENVSGGETEEKNETENT